MKQEAGDWCKAGGGIGFLAGEYWISICEIIGDLWHRGQLLKVYLFVVSWDILAIFGNAGTIVLFAWTILTLKSIKCCIIASVTTSLADKPGKFSKPKRILITSVWWIDLKI